MTRQIEVWIDEQGKLRFEFTGFPGDDCFEEAERLQRVLARLGVHLDVEEIVRKSQAQIEAELDAGEPGRRRLATGGEGP